MTDPNPQELGVLAKAVIVLALVLFAAGLLWYGITATVLVRILRNLVNRPNDSMSFRFILQPMMALIAAIHDGVKDARIGRSPYFRTILKDPEKRIGRLREGLNATARIILLGLAMDVIYQATVLKTFYPAEALIVAFLLAFAPYVVIRGAVARAARHCIRHSRSKLLKGPI
jgi:hypothetical protein